jgi:hypothetical protein
MNTKIPFNLLSPSSIMKVSSVLLLMNSGTAISSFVNLAVERTPSSRFFLEYLAYDSRSLATPAACPLANVSI